jgi:PPK2 family polyphosphate:nucleotide phosphotransferase
VDVDGYRVEQGDAVRLADRDPADARAFPDLDKDGGVGELRRLRGRLRALQELLAAEQQHRILVILQAMDTGGKDGTIRRVFEGVNPQGVQVTSFRVPTDRELAHDYLWRVHPHVPRDGQLAIFNRSHYEDVLVVRVRDLVAEDRWRRRYRHINEFERMLADEGTTILKFFLHISKDEQKERLKARLDEPDKRWKFRLADLAERERWDDYMRAYEEAIRETSTAAAPWWVVPANRKWYRDLVVCSVLVHTLEGLDMQWPEPDNLDGVVIP